ncbi:STAS domain-containing protein [Rossellomorea vietnamensis]|uniref:STAS domain-containing protein n=1 Tax=Rossellomorea vietnamensis TaxID=218284 RepID=A0A5D4K7U9_9BACI|nr:STAS domain-containing protein [Rossellomorea vietnamensis]TYR72929.1 STAS domain-containing protein [Rossellomorea vietnamensis]
MTQHVTEELYRAIIENQKTLADQWLKLRTKKSDSIYSADADEKYEKLLREQNVLTTKTIASSLLDDKEEYQQNLEQWAIMVAKSRADLGTPIYEVLEAVHGFRSIIMNFLNAYVMEKGDFITKEEIMKWNHSIHSAFDQLIQEFSEMYYNLTRERMKAQHDLIAELGAPIIPVGDTIAVLPLIGDIDTERARRIMEIVPMKCMEKRVDQLCIDLSGVPIVDTMVAQQIYSIIQALSLLGIKTSLSGIRPEVAMTSVQLGINFKQINTFNTLKQALQKTGLN